MAALGRRPGPEQMKFIVEYPVVSTPGGGWAGARQPSPASREPAEDAGLDGHRVHRPSGARR